MSDVPTRLLRETLRTPLTPASTPGCMDTETLAAWSDDALSAREREAVESHAAVCARCQALLAAMARTTTPLAPQRGWWRPSVLGWLVPLTAAAVAVAVWIDMSPARLAPPAAQPPRAADTTPPITGSASRSPAQMPSAPSPRPPVPDDRAAESKKSERSTVPPPPPAAVASQREARVDERHAAPATGAARSAFRQATPGSFAPKEVRDPAPAPPPAAPVQAPPQPPPQSAAVEAAPGSNVRVSPNVAPNSSLSSPLMPADIVSPDGKVRWRILTGGGVARSSDGGMTWQTQSTGIPTALTAGTAPSPTTCWLVGPGGIIVLSTDGRTWQRVPFREGIDLTSIRASDAVNATVLTADGRTFITTDGGKAWRLSGGF